ncbi:MarR family transcriptional regulator [Granulicella sp. WH15]|uniref:MarR family winged helix-turn-helix transcriptional regulator n=1 Tax=Granulicella sp. WH15 TaxID=2602070 RepID=UPI001366F8EE|nr:MarR family transcriptional regulator [Granulicella sp. WH15]QHN02087.1 MarR family transcriptional regulator [Granulicella sp. WH15]
MKTPQEKIKKSTRETEMRRAGVNIKHLLIALRGRMDERLRERKITSAQLRLLRELQVTPGISGAKLARACSITPQTAQAMLVRSVKAGWIVRGADKENGRLVTARLTPAGEKLLAYAEQIVREVEADAWAGLSVGELRSLSVVLERVLANLDTECGSRGCMGK